MPRPCKRKVAPTFVLALSDIDRSRSDARKGLGLTEGSLIERRKLPVCATVAETFFPFHYVLIRVFRLSRFGRAVQRCGIVAKAVIEDVAYGHC